MRIAIAGAGYVGLSTAILLAKNNHVEIVDIVPEKVDMINRRISPIQNDYIEKVFKETPLMMNATLDGASAYRDAEIVVIAVPTKYDENKGLYDTRSVEQVIRLVLSVNNDALMVIKSTIPVGYSETIKKEFKTNNVIVSPFLEQPIESKDTYCPSRIIIGCSKEQRKQAREFASLLKDGLLNKDDVPVIIVDATEAEAIKK